MKFYKTPDEDGTFYKDDGRLNVVEINTLDELKAFAWGCAGRVEINFCPHDLDGETLDRPTIRVLGERYQK